MPQYPSAVYSVQKPSKAFAPLVGDAAGAAEYAQRHGANYASTYAGFNGSAACVGVTTSAGLATTYTGLCLSNPAGSGKNLSILRVSGVIDVAPAALTAIGLITGFLAAGITAHTTPLTPLNNLVGGGGTLVGLADAACTLVGTPAWQRWLAESIAATGIAAFDESTAGELLIPPGGYLAIGTSIAGPTNGLYASISWEENPQ